jgi:hypothetical protein
MVQEPSKQPVLCGEDVRGVPLVHPVPDELLEGRLGVGVVAVAALRCGWEEGAVVGAGGAEDAIEVVVGCGVSCAVDERGTAPAPAGALHQGIVFVVPVGCHGLKGVLNVGGLTGRGLRLLPSLNQYAETLMSLMAGAMQRTLLLMISYPSR